MEGVRKLKVSAEKLASLAVELLHLNVSGEEMFNATRKSASVAYLDYKTIHGFEALDEGQFTMGYLAAHEALRSRIEAECGLKFDEVMECDA